MLFQITKISFFTSLQEDKEGVGASKIGKLVSQVLRQS